jgi:hypothetical protein
MHYHVGGMEERVRRTPLPGIRHADALVPRRSARTALLVSLLALAALVRMWGLGFGLPHTGCRPDESVIIELAGQFWSGDLDPHFFRYPTLYIYLSSMAFGETVGLEGVEDAGAKAVVPHGESPAAVVDAVEVRAAAHRPYA